MRNKKVAKIEIGAFGIVRKSHDGAGMYSTVEIYWPPNETERKKILARGD